MVRLVAYGDADISTEPMPFDSGHIDDSGFGRLNPDTAAAQRAFDAMMQMNNIDIAAIEAARRG